MGSGARLYADAVSDAIARAEHLAPAEAVEMLSAARQGAADRVDLLVTLSRASSDLVDAQAKKKKTADAGKSAKSAVETAERAVQLAPKNAEAHLALAIACGKLTDYVDNSTKMQLSRRIRDEAEATIALNPRSDLAYHILGRWNYGIATLNPVLKLAARMAYGALPPASLEKAATLLEEAAALKPQRVMHHQHLAVVYRAMSKKEKATEQWKLVLQLPAADADDEEAKKEARSALGNH